MAEFEIKLGEEWRTPDNGPPRFGNRRLVHLVPTPIGGFPAIWTSPLKHTGRNGNPCQNVILLISREPPQVMAAEIDSDGINQLPLVECEW